MSDILLDIQELSVTYDTVRGPVQAVSELSLQLPRGASIGIVGESGCGKTTLAKALIRLLPANGKISGGSIRFDGVNIARLSPAELRDMRWREIAMVPQSAMNSLNPVYQVGAQLVETMVVRQRMAKSAAWERAGELFKMVGIDPGRLHDYPHQFSGGMKQRATIALAMTLSPKLIIADEPTTALDVLVEARILNLLRDLKQTHGLTLIYITHDLSVVARTCDLMGVMYAGKLVEFGPTEQVIRRPLHPYTMGLIAAVPKGSIRGWEPVTIPGSPPELIHKLEGCRFVQRCPFATARCAVDTPALAEGATGHWAACHYLDQAEQMREDARIPLTWARSRAGALEAI